MLEVQSHQGFHCLEFPSASFDDITAFCIWENKGTDQLYSNLTADQRLCLCYIDSKICLSESEISSF